MNTTIDIEATAKPSEARGRPNKTLMDFDNEAARIIELALMLKLGRIAQVESMGFTKASALRYVSKRRRGLIGDFVGDSVRDLLFPTENRTQRALQLVIEHGFKVSGVARALGIDLRNLRKALPLARIRARKEDMRRASFARGTVVTDVADAPFICHQTPLPK